MLAEEPVETEEKEDEPMETDAAPEAVTAE